LVQEGKIQIQLFLGTPKLRYMGFILTIPSDCSQGNYSYTLQKLIKRSTNDKCIEVTFTNIDKFQDIYTDKDENMIGNRSKNCSGILHPNQMEANKDRSTTQASSQI
jgi:hypothetical protein